MRGGHGLCRVPVACCQTALGLGTPQILEGHRPGGCNIVQCPVRMKRGTWQHLKPGACPAGASIAIDDCYELWESGFISIPFDFQVRRQQTPRQAPCPPPAFRHDPT